MSRVAGKGPTSIAAAKGESSEGPRGGTTTRRSGWVKKNLWISEEMDERLRLEAFRLRIAEAEIIRRALERFLPMLLVTLSLLNSQLNGQSLVGSPLAKFETSQDVRVPRAEAMVLISARSTVDLVASAPVRQPAAYAAKRALHVISKEAA